MTFYRHRLNLERLEDRTTPATSGLTWPDGRHLTLSFVPDGTKVASYDSQLFSKLNAVAPTATWQREIARAFQTWAMNTNLNVGIITDGGQSLGSTGTVQGDRRFGDVRIAAAPLPDGTLMTNTSFQWSGTTWSGDVVINSNYAFNIGGGASKYDLYTCMLNEAGNVLGVLDTRTDTQSGVYYKYNGPKTGITAADVLDIKSLYGSRSQDHFETNASNNTAATATQLTGNPEAQDPEAEITTNADVDYYKFTIPLALPPIVGFTVQASSAGFSTLLPSLTVYNSLQQSLGSATTADPLAANTSVQVNSVGLLATYYVRVAGPSSGSYSVGGYKLTITYQYLGGLLGTLIGTVKALVLDLHLNDTILSAVNLTPAYQYKPDARFDASASGVIEDSTDVDFYQIRSPNLNSGTQKLNVIVWATPGSTLYPKIELYDSAGLIVPIQLLANENGTYALESNQTTPGVNYYLKVEALDSTGPHNTGGYYFGADFTTQPATAMPPPLQSSLSATAPQATYYLSVKQNQLMQFILSDNAGPAGAMTQVRMDVFDSAGALFLSLSSYSGKDPVSIHQYLKKGSYRVRFTAVAAPGATLSSVAFQVIARKISDPIGPQKDDGNTVSQPVISWHDETVQSVSDLDDWDLPYYYA